jgi:branched-chain amino acid transport system permease protein
MASQDATERGRVGQIVSSLEAGSRSTFYSLIVIGAILMWGVTFVVSSYWITVLWSLYMYIVYSEGWNFLSGYTGYASLGPFIFIGLGAYATAYFTVYTGLSWPVALMATAVVGAAFAAVFGFILLRLSGIYFAIGTLLIAEGLREAVLWENDVLGGSSGISLANISLSTTYLLFGALALFSIIITYETATSRFGLRMLAVREDEQALAMVGVNPLKYKLPAFIVHGVLISLAGGAFALSLGFLFPTVVFSISITITLILVAILGGMGTVWGPVIGTLILVPIQELFWQQFPTLHIIVYGAFLVGVIILMPEGLISRLKDYGLLPQTRGI